ncbi:hypothetical protein WMY93_019275 [Mugilogobius chulae]|uniref:C-type lectin domain-containing protein n=1 Tax=Mugilogobius chulae TaxID=88201 RepID=A0AAW0NNK7_9GOBI
MEAGILCVLSILIHLSSPDREFVLVNQFLDWTSAQSFCRKTYTDLVTVYSEEENQKLMEVGNNVYVCHWIGIRHKFHNWRWSSGVPNVFYDDKSAIWADGQPDNNDGDQHCASLSTDTDKPLKYILVNQTKTWKDAQTYCRTHHVDLVSVTTDAVRLELLRQMDTRALGKTWIGLYRDPWTTWSDSTNTSFNNWVTQPEIYSTDDQCGCMTPYTGKWEVDNCSAGYNFFCYTDIDRRRQTILNMKLQSGADLNNIDIQHQITEQMKNRLGAVGETNVKWKDIKPTEACHKPNCADQM